MHVGCDPQRGALYKVCRRADKSFYFHLFNDCLLYSESTVLGLLRLHRSFELQVRRLCARPALCSA